MLHILNTLQKQNYLENGTLSRLLAFTIVLYDYTNKLSSTYGTGKHQTFQSVLLSPLDRLTQEYKPFVGIPEVQHALQNLPAKFKCVTCNAERFLLLPSLQPKT